MSDPSIPPPLREFHCKHCNGKIRIPRELPPTTGPCPHCQGIITSPAPETAPPLGFGIPPIGAAPVAPPSAPAVAPIPGGVPSVPSPAAVAPPVTPVPAEPAPIPQPEPAPPYQEPVSQPAPIPQEPEPTSQHQEPAPAAAPVPPPEPAPDKQGRRRLDKKSPAPSKAKEDKSLIPVLLLILLLFAFAAGAGFFVYKEMKNRSEAPLAIPVAKNPEMEESQYIRSGWKKDAYSVLEKFVAAKTVEEKMPYVIQSANLKANMDSFYGGSTINDLDTPADAFSVVDLTEADHKRGIFLMIFDQPPQFDIKDFFRPLAPLEVQYGIDEANLLLSTFAKVGNFATEPVRVNAFFKKTPEGLKLDWETFAQSKYRTFRNMIELPDPGQSGVFRIQISEDVPDTGKPLPPTQKTYRVFDPSSPEVSARINVNVDSEIGRTLSEINWMGGTQNRPIIRTATLELKWTTGDQPELQINRFICWEFLHLGGQSDPLAAPKR